MTSRLVAPPAAITLAPQPAAGMLAYRGHLAGLDVLRGLAILLVVLFHAFDGTEAWPHWSGTAQLWVRLTHYGFTGVHLFFVLSGFLISGILLDSAHRPDYYRTFYLRRALRILPAYLATLVALKLFLDVSWNFVAACLLYIANMARLVGASNSEYGPLWSLAVEEQFYIVWPWVIRRCSRRTLARLMLAVCIATPLIRGGTLYFLGPSTDAYYKTWDNVDYFFYGALVALAVRQSWLNRQNIAYLAQHLLGLGLAAIALIVVADAWPQKSRLAEAALAGVRILPFEAVFTALLMYAIAANGSGITRKPGLAFRTLGFLGYVSYGLYLVHQMVFYAYDRWTAGTALAAYSDDFSLLWLRAVACAVAAIAISYLSRRFFEDWFLQHKPGSTAADQRH